MPCDNPEGWEGTYVYRWVILVDRWQKLQHCKVIILQLKKKFFFLKGLHIEPQLSAGVKEAAQQSIGGRPGKSSIPEGQLGLLSRGGVHFQGCSGLVSQLAGVS